jgi:hypothetical protein
MESREIFLFGIVGGGVQLGPLGTAATIRPIVPAPGDYNDGQIGGMMIGRGNRSTRRKPAPVPLCPPQTSHAARTRTRVAAVGSQQLTAWGTAWPKAEESSCRNFGLCRKQEENGGQWVPVGSPVVQNEPPVAVTHNRAHQWETRTGYAAWPWKGPFVLVQEKKKKLWGCDGLRTEECARRVSGSEACSGGWWSGGSRDSRMKT